MQKPSKPSFREVAFDRRDYPIVMEPDYREGIGCFVAIPIERVHDKGCNVTFRFEIEMLDEAGLKEMKPMFNYEKGDWNVSLVMQAAKLPSAGGFCASARTLPVGQPCETSLDYNAQPPTSFYVSVYVPAWVKRFKILDVQVRDHRLIEKAAPATAEQQNTIAQWIEKLADDAYCIRQQAHIELVNFGEPATPLLRTHLNDPEPERRVRVHEILAEIERIEKLRMPPDHTKPTD